MSSSMTLLAPPNARESSFRSQGRSSRGDGGSSPTLSSATPYAVSPSSSASASSILVRRRSSPPITIEMWLMRDEAVARCSVDDVHALVPMPVDPTTGRSTGGQLLRSFPCKTVELVGILIATSREAKKDLFTIDDGSSRTLDFTWNHPIAPPPLKAPKPVYNSRYHAPQIPTTPVPPPPVLPVAKVQIGDVVRVQVQIKPWSSRPDKVDHLLASLDDIVAVDPDAEARHALIVATLHRIVYPCFSIREYLDSDFVPKRPYRPRPPSVPSPVPPSSPQARSLRSSSSAAAAPRASASFVPDSKIPSAPSHPMPRSDGASPSVSQAGPTSGSFSSPENHSVVWSDTTEADSFVSSSSAPSSPSHRTSSLRQALRDPKKLSHTQVSMDGFKLYLKEHMTRAVDDAWGDQGRFIGAEPFVPPLPAAQWLGELRIVDSRYGSDDLADDGTYLQRNDRKGKGRAVSFDDDDAPPFSLNHLMRVPDLETYGSKLIKQAVKAREDERKDRGTKDSKAVVTTSAKWFDSSVAVARSSSSSSSATKSLCSSTSSSSWTPPQLDKKAYLSHQLHRLFRFVVRELLRSGDLIDVTPRLSEDYPSSTTFTSQAPWTFPKTQSLGSTINLPTSPSSLLVLPLALPVIGPLLLLLLRDEHRRAARTRGVAHPASRVWITSEQIQRRLAETDERWYNVGVVSVEAALEVMDELDLVAGREGSWQVVGL